MGPAVLRMTMVTIKMLPASILATTLVRLQQMDEGAAWVGYATCPCHSISSLPVWCEVLTAIHAAGLGKEGGATLSWLRHWGSSCFGRMRWWWRPWVLCVAVAV